MLPQGTRNRGKDLAALGDCVAREIEELKDIPS